MISITVESMQELRKSGNFNTKNKETDTFAKVSVSLFHYITISIS